MVASGQRGTEVRMSISRQSSTRLLACMQVPMPYAANLEALALPTIDDVVRVSRRAMGKKPK